MLQNLLKSQFNLSGTSLPTNIQVDSRSVNPQSLFVALKGSKTDGHNFLQMVAAKGCKFALLEKRFQGLIPEQIEPIYVEETLDALQLLAKCAIKAVQPMVIAITGSIGKTTTKGFIATLVAEKYSTFFSEGNQNSQIGLAQTILNGLRRDHEVAVLEMGMSAPGQIKRLVDIAPPTIAVVTKIIPMHIEYFPDGLKGIAREKSTIFSHPNTQLCIHAKNEVLDIDNKRVRTFSLTTAADTTAVNLQLQILDTLLEFQEGDTKVICPAPEFPVRHVYENLLCAVTVARAAGVSWEQIQNALPKLKLPAMRLELHQKGTIKVINDGYNAAELSMNSALDYLHTFQGRRVAILGEMRELAHLSYETHARVIQKAKASCDLLLTIGAGFKSFAENWYSSREELLKNLSKFLLPNDVVLLKGSRSNGLYQLVDHPVWEECQ